jgi:uncharacterized protein YdeI (YjbR/CyaY-like superfamily)
LKVRFFARPEDLRTWFEENHARASELWIGYAKKGSGRTSVTYKEALEEALCYGWIDGQVRSLGDEGYTNRYTPRRPGSPWSEVNIAKARQLLRSGRMRPAGEKAFAMRDVQESGDSSPRARNIEFDESSMKKFQADSDAWDFFASQAPSYRRMSALWVMSAKTDETRVKRLGVLIEDSNKGLRTNFMSPYSRKREK